jgi:hypothetical protein
MLEVIVNSITTSHSQKDIDYPCHAMFVMGRSLKLKSTATTSNSYQSIPKAARSAWLYRASDELLIDATTTQHREGHNGAPTIANSSSEQTDNILNRRLEITAHYIRLNTFSIDTTCNNQSPAQEEEESQKHFHSI